jgi:hypothetical protein
MELQVVNARVATAFEEAEAAREALMRVQSEMKVSLAILSIRSTICWDLRSLGIYEASTDR